MGKSFSVGSAVSLIANLHIHNMRITFLLLLLVAFIAIVASQVRRSRRRRSPYRRRTSSAISKRSIDESGDVAAFLEDEMNSDPLERMDGIEGKLNEILDEIRSEQIDQVQDLASENNAEEELYRDLVDEVQE